MGEHAEDDFGYLRGHDFRVVARYRAVNDGRRSRGENVGEKWISVAR
jgi:hypothetical protein